MESFGKLLFTPAVQAEQDKVGMRDRYAQTYETRFTGPLDDNTRAFIQTRQSFYMASVSSHDWPYIQHRGGPAGFVKILDEEQIGFADYAGNKQFITRGNLETETKVSLFFMDYPRKARLKLLGRARMVDAKDDPKLAARLFQDGAALAERLVVIDVAAVDWNCPKYIEPRYSESEIAAMIGPRLAALEEENELLRKQLAAFKANQS